MQSTSTSLSHCLVLGAALGLLAGCPAKEEETGGTDTDPGTGTTQSNATEAPTSTGPTTGTADDTTVDPSTGTTVDPSTGTTVDPTTGEVDPACACIDKGGFGDTSFTCGGGECGTLIPTCEPIPDDTGTGGGESGGLGGDCQFTIDEAKLDCAIDLLIAGEGIVKYQYSSDQGFSEDGGFIQMFPGREGLTREYSGYDLILEEGNAGVVPLRPVEYFEGCKQEVTLAAKWGCLLEWSDQAPTAQCDAADSARDF